MTRYLKIGAWVWILSIQYYFAQIVVAIMWGTHPNFSWAHNTISDLGNTVCGQYGDRFVCSPGHDIMNLSFLLLGLTMGVGAYTLNHALGNKRLTRVGFLCMGLAGIGTILVGLFPENSISTLHILGASLALICGNIGMIFIGYSLYTLPKWLRFYSIIPGVVGLIALLFFVNSVQLNLASGTMERIAAYPQSIWMCVLGCYFLVRQPVDHKIKK